VTGDEAEAEYRRLLARLRADPDVVGAVLAGSRAVREFVTAESDYDVYIVLREAGAGYPYTHGASIEMIAQPLDEFRRHGLPGSKSEWNRSTFLHVRVEIDKLDGEIRQLVEEKARLTRAESDKLVAEALDDYINALYRSLKNHEAGRVLAARLDAAESIPPLLVALFALDGRVRPFNKWLAYEVQRQPLSFPDVPARVDGLSRRPTASSQRRLFRDVEGVARERGFGSAIDDWEPNVTWLRGTTRSLRGARSADPEVD
jgi:predicted nucleotidyltransferase